MSTLQHQYKIRRFLTSACVLGMGSLAVVALAQELAPIPSKVPAPIMVDGKPFIPNGIYMGNEKCWDDNGYPGKVIKGACTPAGNVPAMWDLDRIAAAGFNTVLSYGNGAKGNPQNWTEHTASIRQFLDRAQQRHLKVVISLKDLYFNKDKGAFLNDDRLSKVLALYRTSPDWKSTAAPQPVDVARGLVRELKNHPAVLAWSINDELNADYLPELQAMYAAIKAEDPDHPVMQLLYRLHDQDPRYDPRQFVSSTDILVADPYPVGLGRPFTLLTVSDWTRKLVAAVDGKKTVWMAPQAYARNFDPPPQMSELAPTPDEMRNMAYQMLINRASGLLFWSLAAIQIEPAPVYNADGTVKRSETELATNLRGQVLKNQYGETVKSVIYEPVKNPDGTDKKLPNGRPVYPPNFGHRWPQMKAVAGELNQLQPALAANQELVLPPTALPPNVQRRAMQLDNELYILVVNTDHREPATLNWTLPAGRNPGQRTLAPESTVQARLTDGGKSVAVTLPPLASGFVKIRAAF